MRVLTEQKQTSIVEAAGRMFLAHGYGHTSMDMIAKEAGASKATLYRYFQAKEDIFKAYVRRVGDLHVQMIDHDLPMRETAEDTLVALAQAYLSIILAPAILSINRLVIGESERFPQLTEIYFSNGPRLVVDWLERNLAAMIARGVLAQQNTRQAAWQFKSQCELRIYERALWGFREPLAGDALAAHIAAAVTRFLAISTH